MTTKISPQMLASLYPDTKFAGVKRTLAKVKNNVEKSTAETNLAINTIEKTFQAKMKLMSTLSGELSGYKDAKEGGFEGGVLKWITASPETQKIFIQKKYDSNTIIPEESSKIQDNKTTNSNINTLQAKSKEDGLFKKISSYAEEQRDEFKANQGQKYDASIDEWIPPVEGSPDSSIGFEGTKGFQNVLENPEIPMPTLDEILASKSQSQAVIDNSTNDDERRKAQNNIDVIDNLYSNMDGLDSFDLEELYG